MSSANIQLNSEKTKRLQQLLIETGLVNEADLQAALQAAQKASASLELTLLNSGTLKRDQLGPLLSKIYGVKSANLTEIEFSDELLELLPEEFMRDKKVLPLSNAGSRLEMAMVNPTDRTTIDEITFLTGMRPQILVMGELDFIEISQRYLNDSGSSELINKLNESTTARETTDDPTGRSLENIQQQRDAELSDQANPLVRLVNSIIQEAIDQNASDIHIEPRKNKYTVRFRVDGILRTMIDVPQNMEASFVTRIKVMAKMDISDHRRPQDGRITIRYRNTEYNLRVNTLPVGEGREKIVIRILRPSKQINDFSDLGFTPDESERLQELYKAPYGIVLVCGPTGSGKTTTLYTVLHKINEDIRNISTVEDPVELRIEGLNQSQVNPKADFTFASSMRALLRQDPDVIMVGEIRDYETLEAAIHAALTGHLVFSTIHSNTTSATITRMIEMGASANLIASALNGVIAQRLVRCLCPHCKEPYEASDIEKAALFPYDEARQKSRVILAKSKGCSMCNQSGYLGRTGLYEIMTLDRELRQLVANSHSDLEIEDAAVSSGMKSLGMSGRLKILSGVTSFEEVARVLGPGLSSQ